MSARTARNGFTLVEILVSISVASIMLTILASAMRSQGRTTIFQTGTADMQQNVRNALDVFRRELRMVGYGMGEIPAAVLAPIEVPASAAQYEVRLRGNFDNIDSRGSATAGTSTVALDAAAAPFPAFVPGERVSIESAILSLAEVRHIASYDPGTGIIGLADGPLANDYAPGSIVRQINEVTYQLDAQNILRRGPLIIADQMDALNLMYVLRDGTTLADPVGALDLLRAATISMHSEAEEHDGLTPQAGLDTEVRIRNLGIVREAT
jgi:prepilin-type N-terminal cleavage/methylation domain-containing protein